MLLQQLLAKTRVSLAKTRVILFEFLFPRTRGRTCQWPLPIGCGLSPWIGLIPARRLPRAAVFELVAHGRLSRGLLRGHGDVYLNGVDTLVGRELEIEWIRSRDGT